MGKSQTDTIHKHAALQIENADSGKKNSYKDTQTEIREDNHQGGSGAGTGESLLRSHDVNTGLCKNLWMLNLTGNFVKEQNIFMILKVFKERKEDRDGEIEERRNSNISNNLINGPKDTRF